MASTKIRGITIELGADTSGISNALKDVNGELSNTQRQLKDVDRLLKLDPTNTELLEQKQRLLGDSVEGTKKKLEQLEKAQKEVGKRLQETGEGQEQYDALTREIVKTKDALQDAEKEAKDFNSTTKKIASRADLIADKFNNAAQKTRALSGAAAGVLVGLGKLAYDTAQNADELNTLAKQTGFTTDELQKMKYASDLIDVDMETITGAAAKMTKQLSSSEDKFATLGVETRNADGSFRNINDIFYDTIKALSEIPNETERDTVAMDIFGKSANELAGIIDDGGASLKALGDEAANMGLIIPQEQIDKANEFNDAIDKVKAETQGAFAQIGTEILEMVLPYIPQIIEGIETVLQYIREMDPETLKLIVGILAVVAAISPLLSALAGVAMAVSMVSNAISLLVANPIVLLVAAIVALVALIAVKGDEIQKKLQSLDDYLQNVFAKDWTKTFGPVIGGALNSFFDLFKSKWDAVKKTLDGIIDFIRGIFTGDWNRAWEGLKEIVRGVFESLPGFIKAPINGVIALVNALISGLNILIMKINEMGENGVHLPEWLGGGSIGHIDPIDFIPLLAKGGVVSSGSAIVGEAGAELLTVSNGRATVQPLTNNHNTTVGDTVINVYGAPGQDVNELADIISERIAFNTQRIANTWA